MISALKVAKFLVSLCRPEEGDTISNLKLQKLLYYAQGSYLAIYNRPLFADNIVAWKLGPVVENVYHNYKEYKRAALPQPRNTDFSDLTQNEKAHLRKVMQCWGQFSASNLMKMTHDESPWNNTPENTIISHHEMKAFFRTHLLSKRDEKMLLKILEETSPNEVLAKEYREYKAHHG